MSPLGFFLRLPVSVLKDSVSKATSTEPCILDLDVLGPHICVIDVHGDLEVFRNSCRFVVRGICCVQMCRPLRWLKRKKNLAAMQNVMNFTNAQKGQEDYFVALVGPAKT